MSGEVASLRGESRSEVRDFAFWNVPPCSLEENLTKNLLPRVTRVGRWGVPKRFLGLQSESIPIGLPVVGVTCWSGRLGRFVKPTVKVDYNWKVVRVEGYHWFPPS